jgi:hypothetical protein
MTCWPCPCAKDNRHAPPLSSILATVRAVIGLAGPPPMSRQRSRKRLDALSGKMEVSCLCARRSLLIGYASFGDVGQVNGCHATVNNRLIGQITYQRVVKRTLQTGQGPIDSPVAVTVLEVVVDACQRVRSSTASLRKQHPQPRRVIGGRGQVPTHTRHASRGSWRANSNSAIPEKNRRVVGNHSRDLRDVGNGCGRKGRLPVNRGVDGGQAGQDCRGRCEGVVFVVIKHASWRVGDANGFCTTDLVFDGDVPNLRTHTTSICAYIIVSRGRPGRELRPTRHESALGLVRDKRVISCFGDRKIHAPEAVWCLKRRRARTGKHGQKQAIGFGRCRTGDGQNTSRDIVVRPYVDINPRLVSNIGRITHNPRRRRPCRGVTIGCCRLGRQGSAIVFVPPDLRAQKRTDTRAIGAVQLRPASGRAGQLKSGQCAGLVGADHHDVVARQQAVRRGEPFHEGQGGGINAFSACCFGHVEDECHYCPLAIIRFVSPASE